METQNGHETTIIEHDSDFIYYILDGAGYFVIAGTKELCEKGDLVVIPARMIASSTLPWREAQEETLTEI